MIATHVKEARVVDVEAIVSLLAAMQDEIKEVIFDRSIVTQSVKNSFNENVHWFIFYDEQNQLIGCCYMQAVFNYWRLGKRFHRGGFYLLPEKRGQGRYKDINNQLVDWAKAHDGVQIFALISEDNERSLAAAHSIGMEPTGYKHCVNHWGPKDWT